MERTSLSGLGRILAGLAVVAGVIGLASRCREQGILKLEKSKEIGPYIVEIYRNRANKERSVRVYIQEEQISEGVDKDYDGKIDKLVFNRNDWKNPEEVVQELYEKTDRYPE